MLQSGSATNHLLLSGLSCLHFLSDQLCSLVYNIQYNLQSSNNVSTKCSFQTLPVYKQLHNFIIIRLGIIFVSFFPLTT